MSKSYIGAQTEARVGPQTVVRHQSDGKDSILDPGRSQKVWNHSPDGFQWGYGGSGPAQLALAILLDVTGDEDLSVRLHQDFKRDKIAQLEDSFVLTEDEIRDWLIGKEAYEIKEVALKDNPFLLGLTDQGSTYQAYSPDTIIKVAARVGDYGDWTAYYLTPFTPFGNVLDHGNKLPEQAAKELFPEWAKKGLNWRA